MSGSGETAVPACEAIDCGRTADWAFIGEGGDLYLCAFHGGKEPVEGWTWIGRMRSCGPCAGTGEYPPTDGDTCSFCDGEGEVPDYFDGGSNG